jgi:hypothetical protein
VSLESRGVTLAAVGFKRRKSRSLDDIENIEAQISYLQEDIGQRLQLLNDSQSTVQFKQSTPRPVDSETERSDSWIVTVQEARSLITLVACGILLGCTIGDMISSSSLISANNDAVFIYVVFGLAPPCGVV